jgi:hypothetical protein
VKLALLLALGGISIAHAATCVVAAPGSPLTITLNFVPPTINANGTPLTLPLTYDVYMGTVSGAETQLATGITTSPYSVSAGLAVGETYYVQMAAQDANGVSAKSNEACKSFSAPKPVITTTGLPSATVGAAYSFAPASTGGVNPQTWAATGLPPGITFGPAIPPSAFGGTPTTAGTYNVILTVTDANKNVGTVTLPLVVNPAPPPGSITITLT